MKAIEFHDPLICVMGGDNISEEEMDEWKKIHIDSVSRRSKIWGRGIKNINRKKSVLRSLLNWSLLFLKWFFPMVTLTLAGMFLPKPSLIPLSCVMYPAQVLLAAYGFFVFFDFVCIAAGAREMGLIKR